MTILEVLQNIHTAKVAPLDAELLLSYVLNKPREYLFAHPEKKLSPAQITKFKKLAGRRLKDEPIAYLTGKKEFYGLDFYVNNNVLIPRPETELIVELVTKKILDTKYQIPDTIIDVGTGSGNIIVSIVKNLPAATRKKINFYAIDMSIKALFMAKKNAGKHEVARNIKFVQSNLLGYFLKKRSIKSNNLIIVANLPYVSDSLYKKNKNSLKYEPKNALVGKNNGLEHYEKLLRQIKKIIQITICLPRRQTGRLPITTLLEISPKQKNALARIAKKELPLARIKFFRDLAGKWRLAKICL